MAAALFAVDPAGIGGASLQAHAGPVRDRWLALLRALLPAHLPIRRIPLNIQDGRLLGGLDLPATLRAGRPIAERGLLAESDGGVVLLAMAERLTKATAGRLAAVLDSGEVVAARDGVDQRSPARLGFVLLDEGIEEDEHPPVALRDRAAFLLNLDAIAPGETTASAPAPAEIAAAIGRLPAVTATPETIEALCGTAMALGIASIRAPMLALRVARAAAALAGRARVADEDAALAARLVFAPRATRLPVPPPPQPEEPGEPPPPQEGEQARSEQPPPPDMPDKDKDKDDTSRDRDQSLDDLILAAAQAAIPPNLLALLQNAGPPPRAGQAGRSGAAKTSGARGRPAGTRAGEPGNGQRLNLIETLRAAAPWQKLRLAASGKAGPTRIAVRREDFRVTHYAQRSQTTIIFVVDASRSSAVNRLAEAKGAVEMLLADCYARRDRVAVIAFRGRSADLLLPPTRSLVRAKRELAGLPGGGGTPLASGLDAATQLADAARRRGESPTIVLLTDGRANVARDGSTGRDRAEADALAAARALRAARLTALLLDTAPRRQVAAEKFAAEMGARYLPLPYANASVLSGAVRAVADAASGTS